MSRYSISEFESGTYILPISLSSYAFNGAGFWTMSPARFSDFGAIVWFAGDGIVSPDTTIDFTQGLCPVVSLKSDTPFSSGDGSYNTPFVVG